MILNQQIEGLWGVFVIFIAIIFNVGMFYSVPNVASPKIDNQLEILKADIEVYKSLRKDNSAPKSLEDLTKPILEFESKDGASSFLLFAILFIAEINYLFPNFFIDPEILSYSDNQVFYYIYSGCGVIWLIDRITGITNKIHNVLSKENLIDK